jgi:hypothetical protein
MTESSFTKEVWRVGGFKRCRASREAAPSVVEGLEVKVGQGRATQPLRLSYATSREARFAGGVGTRKQRDGRISGGNLPSCFAPPFDLCMLSWTIDVEEREVLPHLGEWGEDFYCESAPGEAREPLVRNAGLADGVWI